MVDIVQLRLDYSEESRMEFIAFLDQQIEAETNLLARLELISARNLTKSDDAYFRHQIDQLKKQIQSGEWDRYKVPSREN